MEVVASTTPIPKSSCPERIPRKVHLATVGLKRFTSLVGHGLTEIEAVASTTPIPKFACPVRVPRRVSLGPLNVKRLRRFGGHREPGMEAAVSTTLNPKLNCPVKDTEVSLGEHFRSNVPEDLLVIESVGWRSLRQRRPFRSPTAQRGSPEKFISQRLGSNSSPALLGID